MMTEPTPEQKALADARAQEIADKEHRMGCDCLMSVTTHFDEETGEPTYSVSEHTEECALTIRLSRAQSAWLN